jgi:1L-myo-inositol 1-phosphate cytidylyltransferase
MDPSRTSLIRRALVLAAGNGDRFRNGSSRSKLLTPVAGTPLLIRTLAAAQRAGITDAHIVLGYDADAVRGVALSHRPPGLRLHFHINEEWHLENGRSVLAARGLMNEPFGDEPFALVMGDHVFESDVLCGLLRSPLAAGEALVGIDRFTTDSEFVSEATKVRVHQGRITAIGKKLDPFDALDIGLFVCQSSIFDALDASCRAGDSTLSGGIRRLAARGLVRGVDIGASRWCDIDTKNDLAMAEDMFALASVT